MLKIDWILWFPALIIHCEIDTTYIKNGHDIVLNDTEPEAASETLRQPR